MPTIDDVLRDRAAREVLDLEDARIMAVINREVDADDATNQLNRAARLLAAAWRSVDSRLPLPADHLLAPALRFAAYGGDLPAWFADLLTFTDSRLGVHCPQLATLRAAFVKASPVDDEDAPFVAHFGHRLRRCLTMASNEAQTLPTRRR